MPLATTNLTHRLPQSSFAVRFIWRSIVWSWVKVALSSSRRLSSNESITLRRVSNLYFSRSYKMKNNYCLTIIFRKFFTRSKMSLVIYSGKLIHALFFVYHAAFVESIAMLMTSCSEVQHVINFWTHHKQLLPYIGPFSQDLSAFGDNWILLQRIFHMDVAFWKNTNRARLSAAYSSPPSSTFFKNLDEVSYVKCKTIVYVAFPVVNRCRWMQEKFQWFCLTVHEV